MDFSPTSLPESIRKLFELNHYEVKGPVQIHGAEIDLVARHLSDPFSPPIYVEATIEYVDNDKYGKDVGKLAMIGEIERDAKRLIVSAKGFSLPVKERAEASRISTLTYDELFAKFEKFEKYITLFSEGTDESAKLKSLNNVYEEPYFDDLHGRQIATEYLEEWKKSQSKAGWLVITGEYGTGKTALTKVLQYRWLKDYKANPQLPLPIRIELREFTKQFDSRGLLHHFLDHNNLGHVSIEFMLSLIRSGRALLLLDGYDEMAQYLHARERRTCLEALAELSAGGARGILTSRPNYFTETEELQVFELLYSSLQQEQYHLSRDNKILLEQEEKVDKLLEQFIDRYERNLSDLTPAQTEALISKVLEDDPEGKTAVLNLLNKIFRSVEGSDALSLSGKPVIVSYLLEVVEEIKATASEDCAGNLTEWQIYKLIVDQLMLRDFKRCPDIAPGIRRNFLRKLGMFLSKQENPMINQDSFKELIAKEFKKELNRLTPESRHQHLEKLFTDLRSSATLTRSTRNMSEGWKFSHNSLREFLVAENLIIGLREKDLVLEVVTVTDAMRTFVTSIDAEMRSALLESLAHLWKANNININRGKGQLLTLLWDGMLRLFSAAPDPVRSCLNVISGDPPQLSDVEISKIALSSEAKPSDLAGTNLRGSTLLDLNLCSANLKLSDFTGCTVENCNFSGADLSKASFSGSLLIDCEFTSCLLLDSDFTAINPAEISIVVTGRDGRRTIEGKHALGYLAFHGAKIDEVENLYIIQYRPEFPVIDKIIVKLHEHPIRQRIGLEQRGAANQDVSVAKSFMSYLEHNKLIQSAKNRKELVEVTEHGRAIFNKYMKSDLIPDEIMNFFK